MATLTDDKEYRRSIRLSYFYTFFNSLFTGLAENYIQAFASFLRATNFQFTLISALPQFIGSTFQLGTMHLLKWFRSRKKMNVALYVLQSAVWIPIIILGFLNWQNVVWYYILLIVLHYSTSLLINPVWNSWIMDLIRPEKMGTYFGKRIHIVNLAIFFSFIGAGSFLYQVQEVSVHPAYGFAIVFSLAIIANIIGAATLSRQHEPSYILVKPKISLRKFMLGMKSQSQGRVVLYLTLMSFAVYISSPFYTPYLLQTLHFNYLLFSILTIIPVLPKILMVRKWGSLIDHYGPHRIVRIASFFIIFNPVLWLISPSFWFLLAAQVYAGFAYGLYETSALALLLNETNPANRISLLSYYAFFNGLFVLLGALASNLTGYIAVFGVLYLNAFLVSGLLRFGIFLFSFPKVREKEIYTPASYRYLTMEVSSAFTMNQLTHKFVALKDLISVRLHSKEEFKTKVGKDIYIMRPKKSELIISPSTGKGRRPKRPAEEDEGVLSGYHVYMCRTCNAEFRKRKLTRIATRCPFCGNRNILYLRSE